jgi:hypothetical protein
MEKGTPFESNDPIRHLRSVLSSKPCPGSPSESTQTNWKNISKDELNHILTDEEGFDMVTHLRGDDAASVADFLDRVCITTFLTAKRS